MAFIVTIAIRDIERRNCHNCVCLVSPTCAVHYQLQIKKKYLQTIRCVSPFVS